MGKLTAVSVVDGESLSSLFEAGTSKLAIRDALSRLVQSSSCIAASRWNRSSILQVTQAWKQSLHHLTTG